MNTRGLAGGAALPFRVNGYSYKSRAAEGESRQRVVIHAFPCHHTDWENPPPDDKWTQHASREAAEKKAAELAKKHGYTVVRCWERPGRP